MQLWANLNKEYFKHSARKADRLRTQYFALTYAEDGNMKKFFRDIANMERFIIDAGGEVIAADRMRLMNTAFTNNPAWNERYSNYQAICRANSKAVTFESLKKELIQRALDLGQEDDDIPSTGIKSESGTTLAAMSEQPRYCGKCKYEKGNKDYSHGSSRDPLCPYHSTSTSKGKGGKGGKPSKGDKNGKDGNRGHRQQRQSSSDPFKDGWYDKDYVWHAPKDENKRARAQLAALKKKQRADSESDSEDEDEDYYNARSGFTGMARSSCNPRAMISASGSDGVQHAITENSDFIDSGSNRVISPFQKDFTYLRKIPASKRQSIEGWQGSRLTPKYRGGTLKRLIDSDGTERSWVTHNTYYVPEASARISSHSYIKATPSLHICLNDLWLTASISTGPIKFPVFETNGLYVLDCLPPANNFTMEQLLSNRPHADAIGKCFAINPTTDDMAMKHYTFGHLGEVSMRKTAAHKQSTLTLPARRHLGFCSDCPYGKIKRSTHDASHSGPRTDVRGRKFHFDTHGPYRVKQIPGGVIIGEMIVEDSTRKRWFVGATQKKLILDATKAWYQRLLVGDDSDLKPKIFQFDSDPSTYLTAPWRDWVEFLHVKRQYATAGDHEAHGVAERSIGVGAGMAFASLHYSFRGKPYFYMAMRYMQQIRNVTHTTATDSIPQADWSPDEMIQHERYKLYGCDAYCWIDPAKRSSKLDFKADKGIFVGLDDYSNGYLIYFPAIKLILPRRDVLFDEHWIEDAKPVPRLLSIDAPKALDDIIKIAPRLPFTTKDEAQLKSEEDAEMYNDDDDEDVPEPGAVVLLTRIADSFPHRPRVVNVAHSTLASIATAIYNPPVVTAIPFPIRAPEPTRVYDEYNHAALRPDTTATCNFASLLSEDPILGPLVALHMDGVAICLKADNGFPKSHKAVLNLPEPERSGYLASMDDEMSKLRSRPSWKLISITEARRLVAQGDAQLIASIWVLKETFNPDGSHKDWKGRLVANGAQQDRSFYTDIYAPTSRMRSTRIILSKAAVEDRFSFHGDFQSAFLHGDKLRVRIFMLPAPGYETYIAGVLQVYDLVECIYGLVEAAHSWSCRCVRVLKDCGLRQLISDPCVFRSIDPEEDIDFTLYVDDLAGSAPSKDVVDALFARVCEHDLVLNQMPLEWYQGIHIQRNPKLHLIHLNQGLYIQKLARKFNLQSETPLSLPLPPKTSLINMCDTDEPLADKTAMKSGVSSIAWIGVRPEMSYTQHTGARCMDRATLSVFKLVIDSIRYLMSNPHLGICYFRVEGWVNVPVAFSDSDLAQHLPACPLSTGAFYIFMNGGVISHSTKSLQKVATSTTISEYDTLFHCSEEVSSVRSFLGEMGVRLTAPTIVYEDNLAAVALANGSAKISNRTKAASLRLHKIRELVSDGIIAVLPVPTDHNIADLGTKPLPRPAFRKFARTTTVPFIPP
jgi:hypothetical protein